MATAVAPGTCFCGQLIDPKDKMARCQKCSRHVHLACAVEDLTINGSCLVCLRCVEDVPPPPRSLSRKSSSSTARARILLDIRRLEEEKIMQEKAAEDKARRDQDFLSKKYDLLHAQLDEEEDGSVRSRRTVSSRQKVENWLRREPMVTAVSEIRCESDPVGESTRTGTTPKQGHQTPSKNPATSSFQANTQSCFTVGIQSSVGSMAKWRAS